MFKMKRLSDKALAFTAALAVVGLMYEVAAYNELEKKVTTAEFNNETSAAMVDVSRENYLLRLINEGKLEDAKSFLSSGLATNAKVIKSRTSQLDDSTRETWGVQLSQLTAEVRHHPDTYEAYCRNAILGNSEVVQVAQH